MPDLVDLTGQRFGRWTVVALDVMTKHGARWTCRCDCGTTRTVLSRGLRCGRSTSCGCRQREVVSARASVMNRTHGHTAKNGRHPLYGTWKRMRQRCNDQGCTDYYNYGARGVTVCARWMESFEAFLADMGPRPSPRHSLDRIDSSLGYEPGNVRWATTRQQARNRRVNVLNERIAHEIRVRHAGGESPARIADEMSVPRSTVRHVVDGETWRED